MNSHSKFDFRRLLLVIATIVLTHLCQGCLSLKYTNGVPDLVQIKPGIWRGGQPNEQGWAYLKRIGIKRDVKLNTKGEATDAGAESVGINVIQLPITFRQMMLAPEDSTINAAIAAIEPDGTYVHCSRGQDRTGLVIGVYRAKVDHWPKDKSYQEMKTYGFHRSLLGLKWYWDNKVP